MARVNRAWSVAAGALVVLAAFVFTGASGESAGVGGGVSLGYKPDKQTAVYRSGISSVDSSGSAAVHALTAFDNPGRSNIPVSARFSDPDSSCVVKLYAYNGTTVLGVSDPITLTAGTSQDAGGLYMAPSYVFDSLGGGNLRIAVLTAPTSGTVSLWVGSY